MISITNILNKSNSKKRKVKKVNKENFRDAVASSMDKQMFLNTCRELIQNLEKTDGTWFTGTRKTYKKLTQSRARALVQLKKIVQSTFNIQDKSIVDEIIVHYLLKTPFIDEKIISIKLTPYTFALTKNNINKVNTNNTFSFDTQIFNTNTLSNRDIDINEANPEDVKDVNVNLMYTDFMKISNVLKETEQKENDDIEL